MCYDYWSSALGRDNVCMHGAGCICIWMERIFRGSIFKRGTRNCVAGSAHSVIGNYSRKGCCEGAKIIRVLEMEWI